MYFSFQMFDIFYLMMEEYLVIKIFVEDNQKIKFSLIRYLVVG